MLFNSFEFLVYLPLVFLLYWFVFNRNLKLQNLFVLAASYVFYGWWDWRFLLLIFFTSLCSYFSGIFIFNAEREWKKKAISAANIILNLGILGFFKYFNFFIDSFTEAFNLIGLHVNSWTLNIILPVGISFYTFQALSYSIDVYNKQLRPTKDVIAFFAYVSFFPQLVAGPIERATHFLPQFFKTRKFDYGYAVDGMRQILWGFFKKIVVADSCGTYVDQIFNNHEALPASTLILGAIYFAFQIYGDFSGYSDIAIGTARLFGFSLMRNFNFPYFSRDIAEFWRRWHISLTTWFRDYLYIPLGGSRVSKPKVIRNIFIIFLVSGFWHGANWTYIIWGLLNALYFLPLLLLKQNRKNTDTVAEGRLLPNIRESFQMLSTFAITLVAWVFFRADTVGHAWAYLSRLFKPEAYQNISLPGIKLTLPFILILLIVEWLQRNRQHGLEWIRFPKPVRWSLYLFIGILCFAYLKQDQVFIYFQF
jgi:alginate O-acetyltransferase complex protein AlgI